MVGINLFRRDQKGQGGAQALIFAILYALCLGLSLWNLEKFDLLILWPANGVLLAGCLSLQRRYSLILLIYGLALNLGASVSLFGSHVSIWSEPVLHLVQVLVALALTHWVCGGRLDMHLPRKIMTFAFAAALPAVLLTTAFKVWVVASPAHHSMETQVFLWRHLFLMEYLWLVIMTVSLLFWGQKDIDRRSLRKWAEGVALLALLSLVVAWTFARPDTALFLLALPVVIMAYRLTPPWVGTGLMLTAIISGILTLYGLGPINQVVAPVPEGLSWAPALMHQAPLYYVLLLVLSAIALPISSLTTERRRLVHRLARHSQKAQAQARIVQDAVAAKSRFLAMVSHEMRTPLNAIRGFSDVLQKRSDLAPDIRQQIEAIGVSSDALTVLIEDLLETSSGDEALQFSACELGRLVRQAVSEHCAAALAKGLGVRLDLDRLEGGEVLCDQRRLRAALNQVMDNAVKFSHHGVITLSGWLAEDQVVLQVQDQGPGVPPSVARQIFEPFIQGDDSTGRQYGGAGIGLTAARRHARAMGGDVVLVSASSLGSIFEISARIKWPKTSGRTDPKLGVDGSCRVLVVDDLDLNRSVLRVMLSGAGYEVEEAPNGQAAVALVAQSSFDLVLMDLRMPGMDGFEASRAIRHDHAGSEAMGPTIIAVTADTAKTLMPRLAEAGIDGLLSKPFTQAQLLERLDQVLSTRSQEAVARQWGQAVVV